MHQGNKKSKCLLMMQVQKHNTYKNTNKKLRKPK